jgi:eukaryotic-like serine/threonine-protein kinase
VEKVKSFGSFEVRGELGRGAGGVVYVAFDPALERTAAVKLYTSAPREASAAIGRLRRDAQAAGALGHPNIAAVLGVGDCEGQPWVATEFVPGVSLAQILHSHAPLPIERVLDVWRQLCEGLAHAHREGVFHLDLKPADVRVTPSGEVKVVDFGTWHLKALEHHGPGPAEEGLHYRAPEILAGRRPDRRADVFSVGAIIYELVSYRKAFPGESTTEIIRGLTRGEPDLACLPRTAFTPGFERVLGTSLARSPEERHASFEDVHADLVQLVKAAVPRLRTASAEKADTPPERQELLAAVTRARAEGRLEEAAEGCRKLLELDHDDEAARRAMSEIESVLLDREVDTLVGMALTHAADGELTLATRIAEKVERLAPWSPRYLQLQVYLDEEGARHKADALVAAAREHLAAGRSGEARTAVCDTLAAMPGHGVAQQLLQELLEAAPDGPSPPERAPEAPPDHAVAPAAEATSEPASVPGAAPAPSPAPEPAPASAPAAPPDPRVAEAVALSATALQHFLKDEHGRAREAVERALALDPSNRRALELQKILRVLG